MFSTRNLWTSVLLWATAGCLWVAGMIFVCCAEECDESWLMNLMNGQAIAINPFTRFMAPLLHHKVWMCVTQVALTGMLLVFLNQMAEHYALTANLCNFPVVIFLFVQAGSLPLYWQPTAALAAVIYMQGCRQLFDCYQANDCNVQTFNVFLLFSLASLLVPPLVWIIPVLWVAYNLINNLNIARFFSSLVGIAMVVWIVWGVLFISGKTMLVGEFFSLLTDGFAADGFSQLTGLFSKYVWWQIWLGMYVLMALVAFFSFWRKEGRRRSVRNDTILLHVIWWCLMVLMLCYPVYAMQMLWLSLVPFGVAVGQLYFERDNLFIRILFVAFAASLAASFFSLLP